MAKFNDSFSHRIQGLLNSLLFAEHGFTDDNGMETLPLGSAFQES
ncbi:hypothetical protein [Aeromonas caviae]|jgi:hypothetical protein|nr:hypothetical protein [Aeromonas caviae]